MQGVITAPSTPWLEGPTPHLAVEELIIQRREGHAGFPAEDCVKIIGHLTKRGHMN